MFSPSGLGQTIAVVDRSGKVISTSKHLLNVWKEAKSAYRERKAEIVAAREAQAQERQGYKPGRAHTIDDGRSATSSYRSHRSRRSRRSSFGDESQQRPALSRRYTDGPTGHHASTRGLDLQGLDLAPPHLPPRSPLADTSATLRSPTTPRTSDRPQKHLVRSCTAFDAPLTPMSARPAPKRSFSSDNIDMDLAYGEPPPNLMTAYKNDDVELRGLVGRVKGLLDEAHCVQHSVTTTMASLQKNPEAMAAVALTLGEISQLVKKMAPGTLLKVRALAPSVFALLSSPQFLIAAGVGVGVTVIALGGYKIIKKIQAQKEEEQPMDQMIALGSEVSRIETWRQGIADVEANSVGTSVDGEFITPTAARLSRLNLAEAPRELSRTKTSGGASERPRKPKSNRSSSSRGSSSSKGDVSKDKKKRRVKKEEKPKPKPSPLRNVFSF